MLNEKLPDVYQSPSDRLRIAVTRATLFETSGDYDQAQLEVAALTFALSALHRAGASNDRVACEMSPAVDVLEALITMIREGQHGD